MSARFFMMPLTAIEQSLGASFPHSDLSLIHFQSVFTATYATTLESPAPILTPAIVEHHILSKFTSSSSQVQYKTFAFRLVQVTPSSKTPGALIIIGNNRKSYYLHHNRLPVLDWRTVHRTVSDAHDSGRRHRSAKSTLKILQSTFALLPTDYVSLILSLCHCARDGTSISSRRRRRHDEENTDAPKSKRVCTKSAHVVTPEDSKSRSTHLHEKSNTVLTPVATLPSPLLLPLSSKSKPASLDDRVRSLLNDQSQNSHEDAQQIRPCQSPAEPLLGFEEQTMAGEGPHLAYIC